MFVSGYLIGIILFMACFMYIAVHPSGKENLSAFLTSHITPNRLSLLVAIVLFINFIALLFSLWCYLFGPKWLGIWPVSFLIVVGFPLSVSCETGEKLLNKMVPLSERAPLLRTIRVPLIYLQRAIGAVAGFAFASCIVTLFIYGPGLIELPAFEKLPAYYVDGREVSRFSYIFVGATFSLITHGVVMLLCLLELHYLLYGDVPAWARKYMNKTKIFPSTPSSKKPDS